MDGIWKIPGFPRGPVPAASGVFASPGDQEHHGSLLGMLRFRGISEPGKASGEGENEERAGGFLELERGAGRVWL